MTSDLSRIGPGISLAQRIGADAVSALYANKPQQWSLGEIGGDDYGLDFQVTVFGEGDSGAQIYFNIQLKGTTQSSAKSADGSHLSYAFSRSTLNLWHNSGFVVLVVIADLIESRDPRHVNVHYLFANPELDRLLPELPPEQETLTLRVPTNNIVHRELDLLPDLRTHLDEIREIRAHLAAKNRTGQAPSGSLSIPAVNGANAVSEVIGTGDDLDHLIGLSSRKTELASALAAFRSGNFDRALALASASILEECKENPVDVAITAYLRARVYEEIGDKTASNEMTDLAVLLLPDNDDIAALAAQRRLELIPIGAEGNASRERLIAEIAGHQGPAIRSLTAKLHALNGEFENARRILAQLPRHISAIQEIIVSMVEKSWERVLTEVATARELPQLIEKQLFWLQILDAKAQFELAIARVKRGATGDLFVPHTGLPGIDYPRLRLAYQSSLASMLAGQRLGWPASIQYILDVFPISSMLLGHASDALPLLSSMAIARPRIPSIRESAAKFAVQFDQPHLALQLGELSGDSERFAEESSVMVVAACNAGKLGKALDYVDDAFLGSPSNSDVYLSSLLTLGIAAERALRKDLVERIIDRLERDPRSRPYKAILLSAIQVEDSVLNRSEAMAQLYDYWVSNNRPFIVAFNLLGNLDPSDRTEATKIIEIADHLGSDDALSAEESVQYAQSLLTVDATGRAISHLRAACQRFEREPKLQSLLGVALDVNGQSSEAFELIGGLLEADTASDSARRCFIQIAVRMGFFDRAEAQLRMALSKSPNRDRRLQLLKTLFQLLISTGEKAQEAEETAWQFGKLSKRSSEAEEGLFLQQYLFASVAGSRPSAERVEEFRSRLSAYSETFPKSKYIWSAEIPNEGAPELRISNLRKVLGITQEHDSELIALERRLNNGMLHVPFSWRPRFFLTSVSDVFMLWSVRSRIPLEQNAFHLQCGAKNYDRRTPKQLREFTVVISLTSLLVLDAVGLLGTVIASFPKAIVARSVLVKLQEARNFFSGGWGREAATRIINELQVNFNRVSQPVWMARDDDKPVPPEWFVEERAAMKEADRVYFSDDIIEAILTCQEDDGDRFYPSLSTIDFAKWAEGAGILSPKDVAEVIARLVRLKIGGVVVEQRYLVASIPDGLQNAQSICGEFDAWGKANTLRSILDGIWDSSKSFEELKTHFSHTMGYLLTHGRAQEPVLVALWSRWLEAVRFQVEPRLTPLLKLALGFVGILRNLEDDAMAVSRLWQSFWISIRRGISELEAPEDVEGVSAVAFALGVSRAQDELISPTGILFNRARSGLGQGTSLEAEFDRQYVARAAGAAIDTASARANPRKGR